MSRGCGRVGELSTAELARLLAAGSFGLQTGPLMVRIRTDFADIARSLCVLYARNPYVVDPEFSDFHVSVAPPRNLRRWFRQQAEFFIDGEAPFEPLPRDQAPALLEWGLNWSIAASCHQWFSVHAASLERGGKALIFPAPPGSGKSTLCAGLCFRGWRLLSDELTLLDPATIEAHALARPVNIKNASIDVLRRFEPTAIWSPETYDTAKGRVTHMQAPAASVDRMLEPAQPAWIVFPRYVLGAEPCLTPRPKARTFLQMAENAFNYSTLGESGFDVVTRLVDQCDCYDFVYSRLDDAVEVFDWLASGEAA